MKQLRERKECPVITSKYVEGTSISSPVFNTNFFNISFLVFQKLWMEM